MPEVGENARREKREARIEKQSRSRGRPNMQPDCRRGKGRIGGGVEGRIYMAVCLEDSKTRRYGYEALSLPRRARRGQQWPEDEVVSRLQGLVAVAARRGQAWVQRMWRLASAVADGEPTRSADLEAAGKR